MTDKLPTPDEYLKSMSDASINKQVQALKEVSMTKDGVVTTTGVQNWRELFPLTRIEKIKERAELYCNKGDVQLYYEDVQYLLSKLEIAEKALETALEGDGVDRQHEEVIEDYTQLYNAVEQTLKKLRE